MKKRELRAKYQELSGHYSELKIKQAETLINLIIYAVNELKDGSFTIEQLQEIRRIREEFNGIIGTHIYTEGICNENH